MRETDVRPGYLGIRGFLGLSAATVLAAGVLTVVADRLPTAPDGSPIPKVAPPPLPTPSPQVVVPETTFDFGRKPQMTSGRHAFKVRNEGTAPLELTLASMTFLNHQVSIAVDGGTARSRFDSHAVTVPPRGRAEIMAEWSTRMNEGKFVKGLTVGTNDPKCPMFSLNVEGTVVPDAR